MIRDSAASIPGVGRRRIGESVQRKEDDRFLRGLGTYSDDINKPGQLHAAFVRSDHAHGNVVGIDATAAKQAAGVVAVLTGQDYADDGFGPVVHQAIEGSPVDFRTPAFGGDDPVALQFNQWPMPFDKVHHIGEPVAVVIAANPDEAASAAELVTVEIEPLPSVVDVAQADRSDAPALNDEAPNNMSVHHLNGDKHSVAAALADANVVVHQRFEVTRVAGAQIEPRAGIAEYDEATGVFTVTAGNQGAHRYRDMIASALKMPLEKVRVICPDVGGGFGPRGHVTPEFPIIAWAAKRVGQPVKWTNSRSASFVSDWQGRDMVLEGDLGVMRDGRISAYRLTLLANNGAHTICYAPTANASKLMTTVYDIENADLDLKVFLSTTLPVLPYRAAGRPEIHYAIERLIDMAAGETGMDRIEMRRRNLIPMDQMPCQSPMGLAYDVCAFEEVLDKAAELCGWSTFEDRKAVSERNGMLRGNAVVPFIESPVGSPVEMGRLEIAADGGTTIHAGTQAHGQGHESTYAQVISDLLGIPFEDIALAQGDTQDLPRGGGTHSDRSMRIMGTLLHQMSEDIVAQSRDVAAQLLQTDADRLVFDDGAFRIDGDDSGRSVSIPDVAGAMADDPASGANGDPPLTASADHLGRINAFPYGASAAEVEVDPETGELTLCRFCIVDDCGQPINPMIVEGQIHGGIVQGVGQAIGEAMVYDPETGQALTGSFMDYMMPRADQFPSFDIASVHVPTENNPLGVRAGGEAGTVPALAVIGNAVMDALAPLGVTHLDMPFTAATIWEAIDRARGDDKGNSNGA